MKRLCGETIPALSTVHEINIQPKAERKKVVCNGHSDWCSDESPIETLEGTDVSILPTCSSDLSHPDEQPVHKSIQWRTYEQNV